MMKPLITPTWDGLDDRLWRWVSVFARLKPGVTREQAKAALEPFFATVIERDLADRGFSTASQSTRRVTGQRPGIADALAGRSELRRDADDTACGC